MVIRDTTDADAEGVAALIDGVARERRYLAGTVGFPVESTPTKNTRITKHCEPTDRARPRSPCREANVSYPFW